MRLLSRRMRRLAARAAGSGASAPAGIVWTVDEQRVMRPLLEGEFVAADVYIVGGSDDTHSDGFPPLWRVVERVTRDPLDLGLVYDSLGICGSVTSPRGGRVTEVDYERDPVPGEPVCGGGA